MVVKDTVAIQRDLMGLAQEKYAHDVNKWTQEQFASAVIIDDLQESSLNPQRQWGRSMSITEFESLLKKLSSNFVFEDCPNPTKKRLRFLVPGAEESHYICLYERGPMPEYSIMHGSWQWEADPDFALGKRTMERSEARGTSVSAQEAFELIRDLGAKGAKDELLRRRADTGQSDPNYRPGFKKTLVQWSEAIRGWRAVLGFVIQTGFVTLADIQRVLNSINNIDVATERKSWAMLVR